jgi:hypothetical protein
MDLTPVVYMTYVSLYVLVVYLINLLPLLDKFIVKWSQYLQKADFSLQFDTVYQI